MRKKPFEPSIFRHLASKRRGFLDSLNLASHAADLVPKDFALELQLFSADVSTLLACFSQFPEFLDEVPTRSLSGDLTVSQLDPYAYVIYSRQALGSTGPNPWTTSRVILILTLDKVHE